MLDFLLDLWLLGDFFAWLWSGEPNGRLNNVVSRLAFCAFMLAAVVGLVLLLMGEWGGGGVCAVLSAALLLVVVGANKAFA